MSTVPSATTAASTHDPRPATRTETLAIVADGARLQAITPPVTLHLHPFYSAELALPDGDAEAVRAWTSYLAADSDVDPYWGPICHDDKQRPYRVYAGSGRASTAGWWFTVHSRVYLTDAQQLSPAERASLRAVA